MAEVGGGADDASLLAVTYETEGEFVRSRQLAERLGVLSLPIGEAKQRESASFFLIYRDGCLKLLDRPLLNKGGLMVEIDPRPGEQHSWPAPKTGVFAQAIGKKTRTIVDATAGWAQDSLAMFRMGYRVACIERSPVMAELIRDGLERLAEKDWVRRRSLPVPKLIVGDAIEILQGLPERPDCIYLDPMFPPKRKKSAQAKKSMAVLREILGDDLDREALFGAAFAAAGKRVVVKSPDYAEPLGAKPDQSFRGKLVRYDVYLKP